MKIEKKNVQSNWFFFCKKFPFDVYLKNVIPILYYCNPITLNGLLFIVKLNIVVSHQIKSFFILMR